MDGRLLGRLVSCPLSRPISVPGASAHLSEARLTFNSCTKTYWSHSRFLPAFHALFLYLSEMFSVYTRLLFFLCLKTSLNLFDVGGWRHDNATYEDVKWRVTASSRGTHVRRLKEQSVHRSLSRHHQSSRFSDWPAVQTSPTPPCWSPRRAKMPFLCQISNMDTMHMVHLYVRALLHAFLRYRGGNPIPYWANGWMKAD